MLSAKPRSPANAVAKHSLAPGATSCAICSMARPSSKPLPSVGPSWTTTTGSGYAALPVPGRSPLFTSSFAWIFSGVPRRVLVAVS